MESITARMAEALAARRTTEQVASIDNITDKETDEEPNRRRSLYNGGLALGYLFPPATATPTTTSASRSNTSR